MDTQRLSKIKQAIPSLQAKWKITMFKLLEFWTFELEFLTTNYFYHVIIQIYISIWFETIKIPLLKLWFYHFCDFSFSVIFHFLWSFIFSRCHPQRAYTTSSTNMRNIVVLCVLNYNLMACCYPLLYFCRFFKFW